MVETTKRYCPGCEATRAFVRSAKTRMDLGTKTKWRCPDCDFSVVNIDRGGHVDASA